MSVVVNVPVVPFAFPQGETVEWTATIPAEYGDLAGADLHMWIVPEYGAAAPVIELTTVGADGILLNPESRVASFTISAAKSAAAAPRDYVHDCELHLANGAVKKLHRGPVKVTPEATKR